MARALALVNGRVYTQEHASPRGQAVGVVGNRIAAVGSNEAALDVVGASADRIDLHGRTVIPGFVDAHFHLLAYCLSRERLQLEGARAFEALQVLDSRGELRLRVFAGLPSHVLAAASRIGLRTGFGSQRLRVGLLKLFADGALGSGTAAMLAPYTDSAETNDRGIARLELEELIGLMREAREAGIGVAIHAIGDAAVRSVLDAAETVRSEEPGRQQILRIEHAQ